MNCEKPKLKVAQPLCCGFQDNKSHRARESSSTSFFGEASAHEQDLRHEGAQEGEHREEKSSRAYADGAIRIRVTCATPSFDLQMAFQTRDKLFFVLDYCAGGELFCHLRDE